MSLLELAGLRAGYGRLEIVRSVDMTVEEGKVTVLLGPNGAGKTTLLRSLTGLADVQSGTVRFGGDDLTGASAATIVRAGIGFVPAGRQLFRNQTVASNLDLGMFGLKLSRAERRERIDAACAMFPILGEFIGRRAGLLSGGQQQMLALGQVLVRRPRLLILDEPSLGLAPAIILSLFASLRALGDDGHTVLLVEQAVDAALSIGDVGYVLANGQILGSAPAAELHDHPALDEAFLGRSSNTPQKG
ncbi:ABC transporter ATP-binding protein [Desertimonas flava]|uniref:ABC transporter ATP-binding protein n=1 Tax=Desertimonas flava TaxID=2064846 RepID=UPI0019698C5E|nr:ABC transporter ATP-binding protein [Desertimonas flava]